MGNRDVRISHQQTISSIPILLAANPTSFTSSEGILLVDTVRIRLTAPESFRTNQDAPQGVSRTFPPPLRIVQLLTLAGTGRSVCIAASSFTEMVTDSIDEHKLTDDKEEKIVGELGGSGLDATG